MTNEIERYKGLLNDIKVRLRSAQRKATLSVNAELISMYRDIGEMINHQQKLHGWGAGIIRKLSTDLKNELPEEKGFSERNLKFMVQFYKEYFGPDTIGKQPVSQLEQIGKQLVSQIPWGHNIILMQKIKSKEIRFKYMQQIIESGWSRDILVNMIKGSWHNRQGILTSNFKSTLTDLQSNSAQQMLKDPYVFDFLTITEPFNERELETELIKHLERFLIELGSGFAFVGRQYHLQISDRDFYIDLLFYHLKLRAYIVIELKKGEFKPEYAGKLNFYCSAVDDILRHETDQSTIGLILCETKDKIFAEYALKDINKPIGISEYELTKAIPENLKSSLPSIEQIESEFSKIENSS
jgi:predicted nuclease of restriction endonuclease-like (RecB) superfamily